MIEQSFLLSISGFLILMLKQYWLPSVFRLSILLTISCFLVMFDTFCLFMTSVCLVACLSLACGLGWLGSCIR